MTSYEEQYYEDLEAALERLGQVRSEAVKRHSNEFKELPNILQFGELPGELATQVSYDFAGFLWEPCWLAPTGGLFWSARV